MKNFLIIFLLILFSSSIFAEYVMQPINCTAKKISNCGAYIYNSKTGEVYICDSEECKKVKTPIEMNEQYEEGNIKSSIIPKKESKIPKKPEKKESKNKKCEDSKIPKPGCTKKTN